MKRIIAVLSVLTILILTACENVSLDNESSSQAVITPESQEDIYQELESQLPSLKPSTDNSSSSDEISDEEEYVPKKQPFIIATNEEEAFYQSETAPGTISSALEERNTFLRDKYGADIEVKVFKDKEIVSKLKEAKLAGTEFADMLSFSAKETVNLYLSGLLMDMNTLPEFDATSKFFDKNNATSLATNSTLYMIADPTAMAYEDTFAMFYNRQLVIGSGAKNPETLVMEGKWTWDEFYEICQTAASDVYSGTSDFETDTFAFASYYTEGVYPMVMWTSTGLKAIGDTYKKPVDLGVDEKTMTDVSAKLRSFYNSRGTLPYNGEDASRAFQQGRLVFFCNTLNYLSALRNENDFGTQYGFVPIPKYTAEQENYYCLADTKARVIAVPITAADDGEDKLRFVSAVITAMCATGRSTVREAYLEAHLALYLNTNEEGVMLKTICDSMTFDFSYVFGSEIREVYKVSSGAVSEYIDFGSKVSSTLSNNMGNFRKYVDKNFQ